MKRNFKEWISSFRPNIVDYSYYTDFKKVYKNVDELKVELNILNSLIGSKNIESDFENLLRKYPEVLRCIPILIAVRKKEIYAVDEFGEFNYSFKKTNLPIEQYSMFMRKTGLFDSKSYNYEFSRLRYRSRNWIRLKCKKKSRRACDGKFS